MEARVAGVQLCIRDRHTHRPGVHGAYHRLPRLVGLAILNEAHLAWRYTVVLRQFALDLDVYKRQDITLLLSSGLFGRTEDLRAGC